LGKIFFMKDFLILIREPDGRLNAHDEQETAVHRKNMKAWFEKCSKDGHIQKGSALSLTGKQIKGRDAQIVDQIHFVGTEIVGGYILLAAKDLNEAVAIMQTFPVYEADGYVEVRELMQAG
jgi:hypothetical protein